MNQSFFPAFGHKPAKLVGREQEISDFLQSLSTKPSDWHRITLISGYKGMGKTALALELGEWAKAQDYEVLNLPADEDWSAAFTQLARERKVLAIIDGVQSPTMGLRMLAGAFKSASARSQQVALIIAGEPQAIESLFSDSVLGFLKRSHRVRLSPLPKGKVQATLAKGLSRENVALDEADLELAAQATEGHPYLLQLVGSHLLEKDVTPRQAIRFARQDFCDNLLEPMLAQLSARDMEVLQAVAQNDGPIGIADLRQHLGVPDNYLQPYRARLLKAGVVVSPRRGQLDVALPCLREMLQQK